MSDQDIAAASEMEVEPLDWGKAKKHLDFMQKAYEDIGPSGVFGLSLTILPLQQRYERGERTKWLYDDIMDVE